MKATLAFSRFAAIKTYSSEEGRGNKEAYSLKRVNLVSTLMPELYSFKLKDKKEIIYMEKINSIDYFCITTEEREELYEEFYQEVTRLHSIGIAHGDIRRPPHYCESREDRFSNILLTRYGGIKLIDAECVCFQSSHYFEEVVKEDLSNLRTFKDYFLLGDKYLHY